MQYIIRVTTAEDRFIDAIHATDYHRPPSSHVQISLLMAANFTFPHVTLPSTGVGEKLIKCSRCILQKVRIHSLLQVKEARSMICTPRPLSFVWQNRETVGACRAYSGQKKRIQGFGAKTWRKEATWEGGPRHRWEDIRMDFNFVFPCIIV